MVQWQQCKEVAKDAILLFRLGDFYEAFYDDAILISKELDLTLTKRQDVPMSGVPWHSSDSYIDRLVAKGFKIAIAEQTEDPKQTKGLVKREVRRFVTPGTNLNASYLSEKANNYFAAVTQVGAIFGLSYADLSTGECRTIEFAEVKMLLNELHRIRPSEILFSSKFQQKHAQVLEELKQEISCLANCLPDWQFNPKLAHDFLTAHFGIFCLDGFGLKTMTAAVNAAGALLSYIQENLCHSLQQIQSIQPYSVAGFMEIDRATLSNLELIESQRDGSKQNTLLSLLDRTVTPMGARALRRLVLQPLLNIVEIHERQNAVEDFLSRSETSDQLRQELTQVRDLERLIMRIGSVYTSPRDLAALKSSLEPIPRIKSILEEFQNKAIREETDRINPLEALRALIAEAISDEPPLRVTDGNLFRKGYCQELDELYSINEDSKIWMTNYQNRLREHSGIKTLKVGYTRVSGFYIEVSRGQTAKILEDFTRRATLTNAERFTTPILREYEEKVLASEEKIAKKETELFGILREKVLSFADEVLKLSQALARVDFLLALAKTAQDENYVRPLVDDSGVIEIVEGRHPVIESLQLKEKFIPNDTCLRPGQCQMMLITGPNMAGKSTYIRQVALIAIMAQIGSFVPASQAHMGIIDKLFTRIGASDDLARGQSTFMVEMTEAANILNNATSNSLVILDEIGRGTSTFDGISIAWSIAEYLLTHPEKKAKTLFATHYFELTKLEEKVPGVINYSIAVHESGDQILFLRKIVRGKADRSYGIQVAKLAGLPSSVILRSREILQHLEDSSKESLIFEPPKPKRPTSPKGQYTSSEFQLTFFGE